MCLSLTLAQSTRFAVSPSSGSPWRLLLEGSGTPSWAQGRPGPGFLESSAPCGGRDVFDSRCCPASRPYLSCSHGQLGPVGATLPAQVGTWDCLS